MFSLFARHRSQIGWRLRGRLVFISYRHNDSFDITGRISDHLARACGRERIIRDVESFPIGCDFRAYIEEAIANGRALVAVIGPGWCADRTSGRHYFDNPDDVLCFELLCARRHGIPIYPVLVNGARLPSAASLPPELRFIADLQATRVRSDLDFYADIARLQRAVEQPGPYGNGRLWPFGSRGLMGPPARLAYGRRDVAASDESLRSTAA